MLISLCEADLKACGLIRMSVQRYDLCNKSAAKIYIEAKSPQNISSETSFLRREERVDQLTNLMSNIVNSLQYFRVGIPAIGMFLLLVILFQITLRRALGREILKECHEVGGYYLSIVGGLYGVLIGLIVVDSLTKFETASNTVDIESRSVVAIYALAAKFPEHRDAIQGNIKNYLDEVINVEWDLMEKEKSSSNARQKIYALAQSIFDIEPVTENQKAIFPVLVTEMISLWENRRLRIRKAEFGIPNVEWAVLLVGAAITIIFTTFFFIESGAIHLLMTVMIALLISMSLYLILLFGEPFSGDVKVQNAFQNAKNVIYGNFE